MPADNTALFTAFSIRGRHNFLRRIADAAPQPLPFRLPVGEGSRAAVEPIFLNFSFLNSALI